MAETEATEVRRAFLAREKELLESLDKIRSADRDALQEISTLQAEVARLRAENEILRADKGIL